MPNDLIRLIKALLPMIFFTQSLSAQTMQYIMPIYEWEKVGVINDEAYFYDETLVNGAWSQRKIEFKRNLDNSSYIEKLIVDCTQMNYSTVEYIKFNAPHLSGQYTSLPIPQNRVIELQPLNTRKELIFNLACNGMPDYKPVKTSLAQETQKILAPIKFEHFGKVNPAANLQEAFRNVINPEDLTTFAWDFIFINNILLKLTKSNSFSTQLESYSPLIPLMKDGVQKYILMFDKMASTLGVSRNSLMRSFNIEINDFGLASFSAQRNYDIESQMNMYIWFHEPTKQCSFLDIECQKLLNNKSREKQQLRRDLRLYYQNTTPNDLFGAKVSEGINKLDSVFNIVLSNAKTIENRISLQEINRLRQEREAALLLEEENKRRAELAKQREETERKRQEFLNSPEGKRQIAAEKEAERLRNERLIAERRNNIQKQIKLVENSSEVIQVQPAEAFCDRISSLSQGAAEYIASNLKVSISSIEVIRAHSAGNMGCSVLIDTPKGPQRCTLSSVYGRKGVYWASGICF
jgi:hypothetical protein